jgi:hypothetical protein
VEGDALGYSSHEVLTTSASLRWQCEAVPKILLEIALNKSAPKTQTDFIWFKVGEIQPQK